MEIVADTEFGVHDSWQWAPGAGVVFLLDLRYLILDFFYYCLMYMYILDLFICGSLSLNFTEMRVAQHKLSSALIFVVF